ncbi:uncharacterized protein [Littorina saxatilis]|uniref:uncharacterized protein n=1 Tax=Littorina saxatilis TaxID=31220 RepID=UPI0038B4EE11
MISEDDILKKFSAKFSALNVEKTVNTTTGDVSDTTSETVNTTAGDVSDTTSETVNTTAGDVSDTTSETVNTTTGDVSDTTSETVNTTSTTTGDVSDTTSETVNTTTGDVSDTTAETANTTTGDVSDTTSETVNRTTGDVSDTTSETVNTTTGDVSDTTSKTVNTTAAWITTAQFDAVLSDIMSSVGASFAALQAENRALHCRILALEGQISPPGPLLQKCQSPLVSNKKPSPNPRPSQPGIMAPDPHSPSVKSPPPSANPVEVINCVKSPSDPAPGSEYTSPGSHPSSSKCTPPPTQHDMSARHKATDLSPTPKHQKNAATSPQSAKRKDSSDTAKTPADHLNKQSVDSKVSMLLIGDKWFTATGALPRPQASKPSRHN